jgi:hypothetical protein
MEPAQFSKTEIDRFVNRYVVDDSHKKASIWRIKINGHFIKLSNKKTVWKQKNNAKSALRLDYLNNQFNEEIARIDLNCVSSKSLYGTYIKHECLDYYWKEFLKYLETNKILEFVELFE